VFYVKYPFIFRPPEGIESVENEEKGLKNDEKNGKSKEKKSLFDTNSKLNDSPRQEHRE
jgi:hypothetical protein